MLEHDSTENILERARAAGVGRMLTVSTDASNWDRNRSLAQAYPHLYYTVGLHPHDAVDWDACAESITAHFPDGKPALKCVAIGELGLDFHYLRSPREAQIAALEAQFRLAQKFDLPVIIHCRDAFAELFDCLKRIGLSRRGGVMHCFTGTEPDARTALAHGLKISFSGILTFKNAQDLRDTASQLPLSELVMETDCPFLAPLPFRGKPNEPSYLIHTARTLAEVRGEPLQKVAEQTTQNAIDLFQL
jgi:TatD DNase family protein